MPTIFKIYFKTINKRHRRLQWEKEHVHDGITILLRFNYIFNAIPTKILAFWQTQF